MHKLLMGGLLAAGMMAGGAGAANADHHASMTMMSTPDVAAACMERTLWSDETCACVADRAADRLNEGQTAMLLTWRDGEFNTFSTANEYDLSLVERWEVRAFVRLSGPICAIKS